MGKIIKREDVIHISRIAEIDYDSEEIDKITVQTVSYTHLTYEELKDFLERVYSCLLYTSRCV